MNIAVGFERRVGDLVGQAVTCLGAAEEHHFEEAGRGVLQPTTTRLASTDRPVARRSD